MKRTRYHTWCERLADAHTSVFVGLVIATLVGWTASAATRYVRQDSPNPMTPFDSWATASTNIQEAVDAALPDDLVLVTNGIYASGSVDVEGASRVALTNPVVVRSVNGPKVTVIEGQPFFYDGEQSLDGIRCAYVGRDAILSGFTLTNGNAGYGGGAFCASSGILTNCIITGNVVGIWWYGGGGRWGV